MDPFSITVSVVTLLQISAQVTVLVKQYRDEVSVVDATLNGILNDVDGFQQVLQSMKETFDLGDIKANIQTTGHVGSHWKNLARSLSDSESTLDQLRSLLKSVSKSTSFLDAPRKQLRLKSAVTQIAEFREQIQSYRAALQLSLSTVIVWNQVTLQKSTDKIPDKITPDLNKLTDEIRNLGADLNAKISKLQKTAMNQGFHAESELRSMTNLKECLSSAADVVSTASTTLVAESSERASVKYGSDFGDIFKKDSNPTMQRWISSNTVYEFEDVETPNLDPSETSTGEALTEYQSDSDSDIESEIVRALFNNGKKRKEQGDLPGAERQFKNCLSRFPTASSYTSLTSSQSTSVTGVTKAELLELLTETYCLQGSWNQAKSTMKEKLAITERQTGKKSERFLWDTFRLSEVLLNTKDYTEAHLHGRKSLRGFRKLRELGNDGYEKSLVLLIQICNEQGNLEDEEAYVALLGSHQANLRMQQSVPAPESSAAQDIGSPPDSAIPTPATANEALSLSGPLSSELLPLGLKVQDAPASVSSSLSDNIVTQTTAKPPISSAGNTTKDRPTHQSKPATKDADHGDVSSPMKLLIALCEYELGKKPVIMIGRGREGYNCIVLIDEEEIAKVTGYKTKEEATYAATSKAYKTLVSLSAQAKRETPASNLLEGNLGDELLDPSSDKETYVAPSEAHMDTPACTPNESPSNLTSPVNFLQGVPEIMVLPTLDDTTVARITPNELAQNVPVRRAASDSHVSWHKKSTTVHYPDPEKPSAESLQKYYEAATVKFPQHRRAASTSIRLPEWGSEDDRAVAPPSELAMTTSPTGSLQVSQDEQKRPTAQSNVTFDTIERSVVRPDHTNLDPETPSPRSFSLFPASLTKTFSLQDRRSKSDDPNLVKKKSLRFALLSSSSLKGSSTKRKTAKNASPESDPRNLVSTPACPVCNTSLHGLGDDEAWSHVDNCLDEPSPRAIDSAYELPASDPSYFAVELPAPSSPQTPSTNRVGGPPSPGPSNQSPSALSDLHRAFSKRDLSADKFEAEEELSVTLPTPRPPLSPVKLKSYQRQVLLLGDAQCGKTWLSSAWCKGTIPKHSSLPITTFTKDIAGIEIVMQDHSGLDFVHDHIRRASYGLVHAVLLCFDISSPDSFDNVEHKWSTEADMYLKEVPKILVGCKKDINRGGSQTVWTRDAYKLTAKINARAYFETSAVTMEGLDVLFSHVAQIAAR